jgi:hypothetical protein
MNTKRLLVSLCTFAIALFLVATVSATSNIANDGSTSIEVDGMNIASHPSVIAGETVNVKVTFTANVSATDVRVKVELEGDKVNEYVVSTSFDVEAGHSYQKILTVKVPFELKDVQSADLDLNVKIWNGDNKNEYSDTLRVQRPSYNPVVKSISVSQTVVAGKTLPVDFVLKNMGYNDLEDVYVTVSIPELGVKKTAYFGDLVYQKTCTEDCEEDDTVSGRLYVEVPYSAKAGTYDLEVEVTNDDVTSTFAKQVAIENDFTNNVIVSTSSKTVAVGENAEFTLLLVNPTDSLKIYKVVTGSSSEVTSSTDDAVVAVPAGSSKTVTVTAKAESAGEYKFDVNVFTGEKLTDTVTFSLKAEAKSVSNPIVVLTVVLAIIFLVLLIVLIVLLGKKPRKTEEFGESYY